VPENEQLSIQSWIKRITDNEMPIFGRTVQEVVSVSQEDDTSASKLSQVVLKDAAMTSRILKLANSVYYKRGDQTFSTISRAIMLLGFDTVRSMCLTVALIDGLEQGNNRKHLVREMARSLHAATQARIIASERGDESPEEIYISTLLYHVGDLAFWCFCNEDEGARMEDAIAMPDATPIMAQREALGFSLNELSAGLAKAWCLGDLLQTTLDNPRNKNERTRSVVMAQQLAIASEQGWESSKTLRLTKELANLASLDIDDMTEKLHEGARQAAESSTYYGAKLVAQNIPLPSQPGNELSEESVDIEQAIAEPNVEPSIEEHPEADSALQLAILRELTKLTAGSTNLNTVMEKILQGIHKGVGMDRALFALMTPDRQSLSVKHVLGDVTGRLQKNFSFTLNSQSAEVLAFCIKEQQPLCVDSNSSKKIINKLSNELIDVIGTTTFVIAPIIVKSRVIGLYYADRKLSERLLDSNSFDDFQFFTQQSNLILNHLASKA